MSSDTLGPDADGNYQTHQIPDSIGTVGHHMKAPDCDCHPMVTPGLPRHTIYTHVPYDPGTRQEHDRALDERRDVMVTL